MKRSITKPVLIGLGLIALVALCSGCGLLSAGGTIKALEIEPSIEDVTTRHDTYVEADASLSDLQKRTYLRSSELLRSTVAEAKTNGTQE